MKKSILTLTLVLLAVVAFAKNRTINGVIYSKSSPSTKIVALVYQTDKPSNKTVSDPEGKFRLLVPEGKVSITIEPKGSPYAKKVVSVSKDKNSIEIALNMVSVEVKDAEEELDYASFGWAESAPTRSSKDKKRSKPSPKLYKKTGSVERSIEKLDDGRNMIAEISLADAVKTEPSILSKDKDGLGLVLTNQPKASLLTAGEIDDFSKWKMWEDITKNELSEFQKKWKISPLDRYSVQLTTEEGYPIVDAQLLLKDKFGHVIWETKTDNTGKGELWNNLYGNEEYKVDHIEVVAGSKRHVFEKPSTFHKGINIKKLPLKCDSPDNIDIAFVVDATASMGDEIEYLKLELASIVKRVKDSIPTGKINLASVFFRDYYDSYLTQKSEFTTNRQEAEKFIHEQSARGGGDYPEAMDEGLKVAIDELEWSESAKARLVFLILDAPPHENSEVHQRLKEITRKAAQKGIRIIPVTGSGIDKSTEYLMRSIALATNGTYTFLTDDSGIGGTHIKPTTDKYDVELLNDLMVRLILEYSHSSDCKQLPNYLLTTVDTIQTDTVLAVTGTDTVGIDSSLVKVDPKEPITSIFSWKYYPNPTSGKITVEFSEEVKEFFVTDISGKILMRHEPKSKLEMMIDLSPYPTGIYFIRFMVGDKRKFGRVLLSRDGRPAR